MSTTRFATVEVIDRTTATEGHVLTEVRIDGVKYHVPLGQKVTTESMSDGLTIVTVPLCADSVSIYRLPPVEA